MGGKYTTFKSKTSILIAINSFLEIFHQSGHFVFFFITLSGINFIPVSLAIKMQGHSVVCANIVNIMFFTMSVERVIAVSFPIL
uniref:G-protein coupled receptors family 1 profile domain-containing protein n=1 Tax=Meloidogyne incognita TaxID=6306 RepID=A0A914MMJ9_MELIC